MNKKPIKCPTCDGVGMVEEVKGFACWFVCCHDCRGRGWLEVDEDFYGGMVLTDKWFKAVFNE